MSKARIGMLWVVALAVGLLCACGAPVVSDELPAETADIVAVNNDPRPEVSEPVAEAPQNAEQPDATENILYETKIKVRGGAAEMTLTLTGEQFSDEFYTPDHILVKDDSRVLVDESLAKGSNNCKKTDRNFGVAVVDANFDGNNDILLLYENVNARNNRLYYCWLWDDISGAFVKNKMFASIPNPAIDAAAKQILSLDADKGYEYYYCMYAFDNGDFIMINGLEVAQEWDKNDREVWRYTETKRIDEGMEIIKEFTVPNRKSAKAKVYEDDGTFWSLSDKRWACNIAEF